MDLFELICISSCHFYVGYVSLCFIDCVQRPNRSQELPTWPTLQSVADSTKDGPLSEIYADLCLKCGCPTGKLTCDKSTDAIFCMTPLQLSCPHIAFYAELTSRTTFAKGEKTLLIKTFYPLQNGLSGTWRRASLGRDFLFKDI